MNTARRRAMRSAAAAPRPVCRMGFRRCVRCRRVLIPIFTGNFGVVVSLHVDEEHVALSPSARESRSAVSALMPRLPITISLIGGAAHRSFWRSGTARCPAGRGIRSSEDLTRVGGIETGTASYRLAHARAARPATHAGATSNRHAGATSSDLRVSGASAPETGARRTCGNAACFTKRV